SDLLGIPNATVISQATVFPIDPGSRRPPQIMLSSAQGPIPKGFSKNRDFATKLLGRMKSVVSRMNAGFHTHPIEPIDHLTHLAVARVITAVFQAGRGRFPIDGGIQTVSLRGKGNASDRFELSWFNAAEPAGEITEGIVHGSRTHCVAQGPPPAKWNTDLIGVMAYLDAKLSRSFFP